jgi:nucleoside 2-deoxyribosyltransferase
MRPRVYLAGAIYGTTNAEQEWRKIATEALSEIYDVLNPLDRDYRGVKFDVVNSTKLVKEDMLGVDNASVVLANCEKPGWGTGMEIFYAHMKGKPVLFFTSNDNPSPWLLARARNVRTLENAIQELKSFAETINRCGQ